MKKVLAIVASKRKLGNCEIMVKEISGRLAVPHELQLLRLPDFDLRHCTACYRCLASDQGCVLDDDLSQVLEAMAGADALVVAAPTYFLGAHSSLKVFIDRGISFYAMADRLWGKPAVGVGIAGMVGKEGNTHLDIERFFSVILAKNLQTRILYGALPGEVMLHGEGEKVALGLAMALASPQTHQRQGCCPICGGQTFRLLEGRTALCVLCSHRGVLTQEGGRFIFTTEPSDHPILFDEQSALAHRDWLGGMKQKFRKEIKDLREVTARYEGQGVWIEPLERGAPSK